jgi:hypothetical protein
MIMANVGSACARLPVFKEILALLLVSAVYSGTSRHEDLKSHPSAAAAIMGPSAAPTQSTPPRARRLLQPHKTMPKLHPDQRAERKTASQNVAPRVINYGTNGVALTLKSDDG